MARPLKYKEPLDHVIKIRCTSKEHERFLDVAQGSGLSVSDVLRRKLLGLKIPDKTHILTLYAVKNLERRVFEVGGQQKLQQLEPKFAGYWHYLEGRKLRDKSKERGGERWKERFYRC